MKKMQRKQVFVVAVSLLAILITANQAWCTVKGEWAVKDLDVVVTQMPGLPPETQTLKRVAVWTFDRDHTFQSTLGHAGTWIQKGPKIIIDVRESLPLIWAEIIKQKGMAGTFELLEYQFEGAQNKNKILVKGEYSGLAHITSPIVMDIKVHVKSKYTGVKKINVMEMNEQELVNELIEGFGQFPY